MSHLRMETSSDPYINNTFNDIELSVNTRIGRADKATEQRQTCQSSEALDRLTGTKCQCVHRSSCPTETNSPDPPWIHPELEGRGQVVLEHTSVTTNSYQGQANRDNTPIDDRTNGENNVPHVTIATMKGVLQRLKHTNAKNCLKYEDTNEYLKDEDHKNHLTDEVANCLKDENVSTCFRDEDIKNCSNHEGTKVCLKYEDMKNSSKQEHTKDCYKQEDTKNCSKQEHTKNGYKQEDTKNYSKQEDTKNCLKREETKNWLKAEDAEACCTDENTQSCPQLHKHDILTELHEQEDKDISKDILQKLEDNEVVREWQILDTLRDIHLSNLQLLEQVGKSEPAVRRVLGRHQLTIKDVKDVSIDEDIQAQVNTFLRTNVTGNLLLTRVLRENYSIFHSWLSAHLQVERNAGVSRFKQALQMIDTQRRKKLEMADFLSDVANRMQRLLQACNAALPDKPKPRYLDSSFHVPAEASKSRDCGSKCDTDPLTRHLDTVKKPVLCNNVCCETDDQCPHKICSRVDRFLDTSESGCRTRKPTSNGQLDAKTDHDTWSRNKTFSEQGKHNRKPTETNDCQMYTVIKDNYLAEKDTGSHSGNEDKTCARGHSTRGGICDQRGIYDLSDGEANGWRSLIPDSLDGLSSVCERLISDHKSCFQLIGLDPSQCLSLTEAVWVALQHRCQGSFWDQSGKDRRLEALQQENRNLLNELNVLKSRLVDKNVEVLSLQNRLERVEALLKDSTCSTVGKWDTRGELGTPKKANKSSHNIRKICADLLGTKPTTSDSNSGTSRLYPVLQCSAMTSNERITAGNKTTSRIQQRFGASGEDSISMENSVRGLTDTLPKQLRLKINDTGLDNARTGGGKNDTHDNETAGLQTGNVTQIQPHRRTTSRVGKKNAGEQTSWRHSLNVVQGSLKLKGVTDQEHAAEAMPTEDRPDPFCQPGQLLVQKTHVPGGQPAARCSPSSQIRSTDCPANTCPVTATTCTISESQNHQNGYKHDSKDSRGKKNKAQCRLNMCERNDEEKESSKMKTKCVLHANVVSLVSSMMNDSTSVLLRTGQPGKATVTKCLRCQKLFNWADNHTLACSYHSEPMASPQKYDQAGRILPVFNQWRCCLQPENSQGCCLGQHI